MAMVMEDGSILEDAVSHPHLLPDHADHADYSTLKRSLSRIKRPARPQTASSLHALHTNYDQQQKHTRTTSPTGSMRLDMSVPSLAAETALAALQYLPTPLVVLSSSKTIVLANEAMGRLLGLRDSTDFSRDATQESMTDVLGGQTLSQMGIDLLSDGVPVWVSWEKFLDNLAAGLSDSEAEEMQLLHPINSGETTPTAAPTGRLTPTVERGRSPARRRALTEDTAVDVIVSYQMSRSTKRDHRNGHRNHKGRGSSSKATCRMIISIWSLDDERYFTLSFTSPLSSSARSSKSSSNAASLPRTKSTTSSQSNKSSLSHTPSSSRSSSVVTSPSEVQASTASFPPLGTAAKVPTSAAVTDFHKVTRMKDAMLNAMEIPVLAMWKDESVVFPNPAARRLLAVTADPTTDDCYDFMSRFRPYTADFERELDEHENPIIKLCRTQKAFSKWEIGLINEKTGKRSTYDVSGYPVTDDKTGEFFAGLIAFKDVTEYAERIAIQTAENEQQFQLICDTMPQMLWTTKPDGYHDYFSQRWYDYTGLSVDECMGLGWKLPFHPEDMPETGRRWAHSLATGEEYLTEYRCQRFDGEWRWMLGRALPLKDPKTGTILKWFGTCTDIQDIVDAREASQQARHQLVDVLKHAQMTMWIIDRNLQTTFFEGDVDEALKKVVLNNPAHLCLESYMNKESFRIAIDKILDGKSDLELLEVKEPGDKWYRLRLVPQRGEKGANGLIDKHAIIGAAGISMDVTQLKIKEAENIKLLANESAAKEASKMKSSFLANMSHEIRTPIAGVLGMSELLMDTELDPEQSEFAQNIQRSANSLLTVINDILDFSKIESGRLDIEEVQFSLSVVLKDVAKMLSYAAQRKSLEFTSDIQLGSSGDLVLLGDPGRIRQILTNLLTNSIKFTSIGFVRLTVKVLENTSDTTIIEFGVEDTGIGIEEEVKKRLFRPFSQADSSTARRFGGTGLGLTISKNLVDLMHGSIRLESKLGHGTRATFQIPFKKPEFSAGTSTPLVEIGAIPDRLHSELSLSCNNSSMEDLKPRKSSPPLQSPKSMTSIRAHRASKAPSNSVNVADIQREQFHILVVEDNPVNQQIALKFIKSLKFSVSAVWNGKEALQYILRATNPERTLEEAEQYPIPSLILMDCQMPVLDGYHTTHVLRHHHPYTAIESIRQTPIVAMTASAIQGDREKCERAGMDDYLAKPVKRPVLETMILKWILRRQGRPSQERTQSDNSSSSGGGPLKPALSRTETDHSSTCADVDQIAADILKSRMSGLAMGLPTPAPSQRPPMAHKMSSIDQQRRSSLSRNILVSEIPGGETEAESGLRRAEAEEKASSLRDAKLLAATDPGMGRGESALTPLAASEHHPFHAQPPGLGESMQATPDTFYATAGSPLPKSYPDQGTSEAPSGVMALTEANVEKLNKDSGAMPRSTGYKDAAKLSAGYFGSHPTHTGVAVGERGLDDQASDLASEVGASEDDDEDEHGRRVVNGSGVAWNHHRIPDIPGPPPDVAGSMRAIGVNTQLANYLDMTHDLRGDMKINTQQRPTVLKDHRSTTRDSRISNTSGRSYSDQMDQSSDSTATMKPSGR